MSSTNISIKVELIKPKKNCEQKKNTKNLSYININVSGKSL